MQSFKLRPYQERAHKMIIEKLRAIQSLLIVMPTGSGKSKTFVSFVDKYKAYYNFVMVVYRNDLVNQLAKDLDYFGIKYGVYMANDARYNPAHSVQVCSIDTLSSRSVYPFCDEKEKRTILIIDEADETTRPAYKTLVEKYKENKRNKVMGFTATAFDEALLLFDDYIVPVTAIELRDKYRALVDFNYFCPVVPLDLKDATLSKGDFSPKFVESVSNNDSVIKTHFDFWLRFGDDRQTLVFCTSVDHAKRFAQYVNFYYGRDVAVAVSAETPSQERKKIYSDFSNGLLRFLVNVQLITRGVDIPEIGTILDLALTAKINKHIQKIGRGSRPSIYPDCIVIDCVGNVYHNMPFYYERTINLEQKKRTKSDLEKDNVLIHRCGACFRIGYTKDFVLKNACPFCGGGYKEKEIKEVKYSKAKLKKLEMENASPERIEQVAMINDFKKMLWRKMNLGRRMKYREAKIATQNYMINKYGQEKISKIKGAIGL